MKYIQMIVVTVFIALLFGCGISKDKALIGEWVCENDSSPVSVIIFDGKTATFNNSVFGITTQYQYTIDAKEGALNLYPIDADLKTAKPTIQKYTVNGDMFLFPSANGPLTFRRSM